MKFVLLYSIQMTQFSKAKAIMAIISGTIYNSSSFYTIKKIGFKLTHPSAVFKLHSVNPPLAKREIK